RAKAASMSKAAPHARHSARPAAAATNASKGIAPPHSAAVEHGQAERARLPAAAGQKGDHPTEQIRRIHHSPPTTTTAAAVHQLLLVLHTQLHERHSGEGSACGTTAAAASIDSAKY